MDMWRFVIVRVHGKADAFKALRAHRFNLVLRAAGDKLNRCGDAGFGF
jgi:hypothetical protein